MNTGQAGEAALAVAERLLEPEAVLNAVSGPDGASLAHGLAGTALLHARLAAVDPIFSTAAARHWAAAADHARRRCTRSAGVFTAGGGLATSLIIGMAYLPDPAAQQASVGRAAIWLSRQAEQLAEDLAQRQRSGHTWRWGDYDVINGLAGIGRVLLSVVTAGQSNAEPGLIAALGALTTLIQTHHRSRPGWWVPASMQPSSVKADPSGSAATGMAHGIAGPLAFLAAARLCGLTVHGQDAAIRHTSQWVLRWKNEGTWQWPTSISGTELDAGEARLTGRQDAWCYGTPGISAALALAGRALDDNHLAVAADEAVASLAGRPSRTWDADGPTLCHGHAGVLQCAAGRHFEVASSAASAVLSAVDATCPFAIPHTDKHVTEDRPGFLTGAAGAALALAEHASLPSTPVGTRWDCVLLLS